MALPNHLSLQANYLRQLNQRGDAEAVIRQFEGGRVTSTEATLGEYVKALVKVDRLDSSALVHTLQVSSAYQLPNSEFAAWRVCRGHAAFLLQVWLGSCLRRSLL